MKLLKREPGKKWERIDVENTLEDVQAAVGGYIESHRIVPDCDLLVDEDGRAKGLTPQDFLGCRWYGNLVIAGVKRNEWSDAPGGMEEWL